MIGKEYHGKLINQEAILTVWTALLTFYANESFFFIQYDFYFYFNERLCHKLYRPLDAIVRSRYYCFNHVKILSNMLWKNYYFIFHTNIFRLVV